MHKRVLTPALQRLYLMFVVSVNKVGQAHITLAPQTCFVWAREARLQEEPGRYPIGLFTTKGTILSSLVSIYIILELNFKL